MTDSRLFGAPALLKLNRRGLFKGGAALAATTMLGSRAFAQTPVMGGTLRLSYPNPIDSLDPFATLTVAGQQLAAGVFDKLIQIAPDGFTATPNLATSWAAEKDGEEWVFQLREGVKFHDGRAFTSADVVATVERALDKARAGRAYGSFGPLAEIRAEGDHAVRFVLLQRFAQLPFALGSRWSSILPADRVDTIATDLIGTGPFKLKDHRPGTSTTLERNPDYWREGAPYLDEVAVVSIAESIAQQAAIRGGLIDVLNQMGVETYMSLRNADGIVAKSQPTSNYQVLFTLANKEPFTDVRVREAFKYLIDRKGLLASALLGQGTIGNDVPLLPTDPMIPELEQNDQDLPRAKALLDAAGVKELTITCWTSSERPPSPKMALALQDGASKIGVKINVTDIPYTQYVSDVSRKEPLYTAQWAAQYSDYDRLYRNYHSNGGSNYSGVETVPGLDSLIEDIIAEVDDAKRKANMAKALGMIHKGSDRVIPYFQNQFSAVSEKVQNYTPPVSDVVDLRDIWIAE